MNLEHQGIITEKRGKDNVGAAGNNAKFLTNSWSSSHISYNIWTWTISSSAKQRRGEERGDLAKKSNSCLTNMERKRCKKSSCCFQNIEDRKGGKIEERGDLTKKKQVLLPKKSNNCHIDFARSHMNIIYLISSEPDRQIGQSEVVDSSSREVVEVVDRSKNIW